MTRHYRCPFRAGDDKLRESKQCHENQGYNSIQRINEHLRKVHSWDYVCPFCKVHDYSFVAIQNLPELKQKHEASCNAKSSAIEEDPGVELLMTQEQQERWWNWRNTVVPELEGDGKLDTGWKKIYRCLYPQASIFPPMTLTEKGYQRILSGTTKKITPSLVPGPRTDTKLGSFGLHTSNLRSSHKEHEDSHANTPLLKVEGGIDPCIETPHGTKYPPLSLSAHRVFDRLHTPRSFKSNESIPSLMTDRTGSASPASRTPDNYRSLVAHSSTTPLLRFVQQQNLSHDDFVKSFTHMLITHIGAPDGKLLTRARLETKSLLRQLASWLERYFEFAHVNGQPTVADAGGDRVLRKEIAVQCAELLQLLWTRLINKRGLTTGEKLEAMIGTNTAPEDRADSSVDRSRDVWCSASTGLRALLTSDADGFNSHLPLALDAQSVLQYEASVDKNMDFITPAYASVNKEALIGYSKTDTLFELLLQRCRSTIERYCFDKLELISRRISTTVRHGRGNADRDRRSAARFHVEWDILGFLRANYPTGLRQNLGHVLCFVGQPTNAQLTTIRDYFEIVWPQYPYLLLNAIDCFTNQLEIGTEGYKKFSTGTVGNSVAVAEDGRLFIVKGKEDFMIAMGQQIAFLALACRTTSGSLVYSHVDFVSVGRSKPDPKKRAIATHTFHISVTLELAAEGGNKSCWNALMGQSVLVAGYPIPKRPDGVTGLESQVGVLSSLIGIRQAITYRGGYVLKGKFHALVPIERNERVVRWHMIDTSPKKLAWVDVDKYCPNRVLGTNQEDFESLQTCRAILGWCGDVENIIGTHKFPYDQVKYTKASLASTTRLGVSELTIGVTQIIQATTKFTLSKKEGVSTRERSDFYEHLLEDASGLNIFVYDTKAKRAIHTNGERFILQCILHAHRYDSRMANGKMSPLAAISSADNLREAMISKAHIPLKKGILLSQTGADGTLYFKDKVLEFYERLDRMQSHVCSQPPMTVSVDFSRNIHGWEYLELIKSPRQMHAKQVKLRNNCGSWPSFAKDPNINGIFMIGHGFGDLLRPVKDVCPLYQSIPEGLDYLGVAVSSLAAMYEEHGSSDDQGQLTSSGWAWHCPGLLFEPCNNRCLPGNMNIYQCDRVQDFLAPSSTGITNLWKPKLRPPGPLKLDGAAIFGLPRVKNARISRSSNGDGAAREFQPTISASSRLVTSLETLSSTSTSCFSTTSDFLDLDDRSSTVVQFTPASSILSDPDAGWPDSVISQSTMSSSTLVTSMPKKTLLRNWGGGRQERVCFDRKASPLKPQGQLTSDTKAQVVSDTGTAASCSVYEKNNINGKRQPPLRRKKGYELLR